MSRKQPARAYLDGFGTARSLLGLERTTLDEILTAVEPERDLDPLLTPWKRGYRAAVRSAFGH
jgi:hypothetical protein